MFKIFSLEIQHFIKNNKQKIQFLYFHFIQFFYFIKFPKNSFIYENILIFIMISEIIKKNKYLYFVSFDKSK